MGRNCITLDDLHGWAREQAERKLGINRAGTHSGVREVSSSAPHPADAQERPSRATARAPNKTEADYNRRYLDNHGLYERVTFHLPGGSRYTPDYMTVDAEGHITFHEVKGSYRLHSHGRARTAFRECAAAFTMFRWVWSTRQSSGEYTIENF